MASQFCLTSNVRVLYSGSRISALEGMQVVYCGCTVTLQSTTSIFKFSTDCVMLLFIRFRTTVLAE